MHASLGKGVRLLNFTFLKIKFTSYRFFTVNGKTVNREKPEIREKPSIGKNRNRKSENGKP